MKKERKAKAEKPQLSPLEKKKKIKSGILYWVILNLGVLLTALGVFLFKGPNNFATGGVSGIAIIIARFTANIPFFNPARVKPYIKLFVAYSRVYFSGQGLHL